jgi:hypothetical protein
MVMVVVRLENFFSVNSATLTADIKSIHAHPVHGIQETHCGEGTNMDRPQRYFDTIKLG